MSRHLLQNGLGPILDIIKYLQSFAVFFEILNFEELLQHFWATNMKDLVSKKNGTSSSGPSLDCCLEHLMKI